MLSRFFFAAAGKDKTTNIGDLSSLSAAGLGHDSLTAHHSDTILKNSSHKGQGPATIKELAHSELRQGHPIRRVKSHVCKCGPVLPCNGPYGYGGTVSPPPKAASPLLLLPHSTLLPPSIERRARGDPSKEAE